MSERVAIAAHLSMVGSAVLLRFDGVVIAVLGLLAGYAVGRWAERQSANAGEIARSDG